MTVFIKHSCARCGESFGIKPEQCHCGNTTFNESTIYEPGAVVVPFGYKPVPQLLSGHCASEVRAVVLDLLNHRPVSVTTQGVDGIKVGLDFEIAMNRVVEQRCKHLAIRLNDLLPDSHRVTIK